MSQQQKIKDMAGRFGKGGLPGLGAKLLVAGAGLAYGAVCFVSACLS
jgi:hypothetical protein